MNSPAVAEARVSTARRKARILALQVLYEVDGARHAPDRVFDNRLGEGQFPLSAEEYARKLIEGVLGNRSNIDALISTYAPAWPIGQMAMVDRNILRVAIFEIVMGGETPPKVAINEAVELGKLFGADSSAKFVNGVLGSVIESVERESKA